MVETLEMKKLKIETLRVKLEDKNQEYGDKEYEIEELQDELEKIQDECDSIETQIKEIEQEIELSLFEKASTDELTFARDFYLAALFCNHFEKARSQLKYVNITENILQGCNGYMAVEIKNDEIPMHLKNKLVPWDDTDLDNPKYGEFQYLNVSNIFSDFLSGKVSTGIFTKSQIQSIMVDNAEKGPRESWIFTLCDVRIAVNPEYLQKVLKCFSEESIRIYWQNPVNPIVFETEKIRAMLLPMRI